MENLDPPYFTVQVLSDKDEEYLMAQVYYGTYFVCEVDTKSGDFGISFHSGPYINYNQGSIHAKLNDFIRILEVAKTELKKFPNGLKES